MANEPAMKVLNTPAIRLRVVVQRYVKTKTGKSRYRDIPGAVVRIDVEKSTEYQKALARIKEVLRNVAQR